MPSPTLRRLAGLAPPALRRAAAGAMVDLRNLPARLADPARRGDPWAFRHNVGDGDFRAVGQEILAALRDHAGFAGTERVLDIGCGAGRVAAPLAPILAARGGRYLGFDISRSAIAYCRRRFAGQPQLAFEHLDVWNGDYNPGGRTPELEASFPAADGAFDLAFATSVFTHMRLPAVRRYLAEAARTLAPGGRFAFTAFALEPGREASEAFPFRPFDQSSAVIDPRSPERAIGHRREAIEQAVAAAGLTLAGLHRGWWAPGADYAGGQDLFVAVKPPRGQESRPPG